VEQTVDISKMRVVNAMTGASSFVEMTPLPELATLTELEEQQFEDFLEELKTGKIAEVVMLRPPDSMSVELNTCLCWIPVLSTIFDSALNRAEDLRFSRIPKILITQL
jgi:hypothetical protein